MYIKRLLIVFYWFYRCNTIFYFVNKLVELFLPGINRYNYICKIVYQAYMPYLFHLILNLSVLFSFGIIPTSPQCDGVASFIRNISNKGGGRLDPGYSSYYKPKPPRYIRKKVTLSKQSLTKITARASTDRNIILKLRFMSYF